MRMWNLKRLLTKRILALNQLDLRNMIWMINKSFKSQKIELVNKIKKT